MVLIASFTVSTRTWRLDVVLLRLSPVSTDIYTITRIYDHGSAAPVPEMNICPVLTSIEDLFELQTHHCDCDRCKRYRWKSSIYLWKLFAVLREL